MKTQTPPSRRRQNLLLTKGNKKEFSKSTACEKRLCFLRGSGEMDSWPGRADSASFRQRSKVWGLRSGGSLVIAAGRRAQSTEHRAHRGRCSPPWMKWAAEFCSSHTPNRLSPFFLSIEHQWIEGHRRKIAAHFTRGGVPDLCALYSASRSNDERPLTDTLQPLAAAGISFRLFSGGSIYCIKTV